MSQAHLARQSLQFLRGKAHALAEEVFPDRRERYRWLVRNSPDIHMSRLSREQLLQLIAKFESTGSRNRS